MQEDTRKSGDADVRALDARPVLLVDGARNPSGRVVHWTIEDLIQQLTTLRSAEQKIDAPGWLPVLMRGDSVYRRREDVAELWALVCDIDDGARPFEDLVASVRGAGFFAVVHTTWSHSEWSPKARVVLPFDVSCPASQWPEVWAAGAAWAETWCARIDPACKDPSRLYFLPCVDRAEYDFRSEWFDAEIVDGACVSWRWLVANHLPAPPVMLPPPPPLASAGQTLQRLDRTERRRRSFAAAVLSRRAELVAQASPGGGGPGRNVYAYTGGRAVGQLVRAGVLDESEGHHVLVSAAMSAGLSQQEADRAVRNGIHKGKEDGPWDFSHN